MMAAVFLLGSLLLPTQAATAMAGPVASFHFQRSDGPVKDWRIDWDASDGVSYREGDDGERVTLSVGAATKALLLAGRPAVVEKRCETREKHIAQTGRKEITYAAPERLVSCVFNYSDDERLNQSAHTFIALAETVQIGNELARRHRFDRLGLDAEMDVLTDMLRDERALEVRNIAPVLQAILDDERVMERVRRKAAHLLERQ